MKRNFLFLIIHLLLTALFCTGCGVQQQTVIDADVAPATGGRDALTPLMAAAETNDVPSINRILKNGANINETLPDGRSAAWFAYENAAFESFKLLLENGADIRFLNSANRREAPQEKKRLLNLASEFQVCQSLQNSGNRADLSLFDAYYSLFPNGFYFSEVQDMLAARMETDLSSARSGRSPAELEKIYAKYAAMGRHGHIVTATRLNIRSDWNLQSGIVGSYMKNDRIFARENKLGWLKTDRGWVSSIYTQKLNYDNPLIKAFLNTLMRRIHDLEQAEPGGVLLSSPQPAADPAPVFINAPESPGVEPSPETQPTEDGKEASAQPKQETDPVQAAFDKMITTADLKTLETFIQTYKDSPDHQDLIMKARDKYKTLLINE